MSRTDRLKIERRLAELGLPPGPSKGLRARLQEADPPDGLDKRTVDRLLEGLLGCQDQSIEILASALGVERGSIVANDRVDDGRALRLAVLLSGSLSYIRDIEFGLRRRLESLEEEWHRPVELYHAFGPDEPRAADGAGEWRHQVEGLLGEAAGFDYHVAIGTQAAMAFREALGDRFGIEAPFLFLGVTDPVNSGLVESLRGRDERPQVAGVAYGNGIQKIARRAHSIFKGRRIMFVHRRGIPQDETAAHVLKLLSLGPDPIIEVAEATASWPTLDDLPDPEAVYLSWYTFERMHEHEEHRETLARRITFATTRGNVRRIGGAPVGSSADDKEVGRIGGDLIARRVSGKETDWGRLDVVETDIQHWVNCDNLRVRGIALDPEVYRSAGGVFCSSRGGRCACRPREAT